MIAIAAGTSANNPFNHIIPFRRHRFILHFSRTSGEINEFMKMNAINLVEIGLKQVRKRIYGANVTVMGLADKKNINDPRESLFIKIMEELVQLGAKVRGYDLYVPSFQTCAGEFTSAVSIDDALDGVNCAVFLTDHDVFREILLETMKEMMALPIVVHGKKMFIPIDGIIYFGIGKANGHAKGIN